MNPECPDCNEPLPEAVYCWSNVGTKFTCPKCQAISVMEGDDFWDGEDEYSAFCMTKVEP